MRIAYLECFSGISGDMFLGALVDAGVPLRLLEETVAALDAGARLEISRVVRSGISATKVDVWADGEKDLPREEYWAKERVARAPSPAKTDHEHGHESSHEAHHHEHAHHDVGSADSDESSRTAVSAPHRHGRGLSEIRHIISNAAISGSAKQTAISIFEALGEAEAKIHNTSVEQVHFH